MRLRWTALVMAGLLAASACSSGSDPEPKLEKVVTTIDPAKAEILKLGDDLKIVADLPARIGKSHVGFTTFTPDGKMLGSMSLPEKPSGRMGGVESQSHPVLYDAPTKKVTILDDRDRETPTQIIAIEANDDTIVWIETPDTTIGSGNFAVYAYDRESTDVAELAAFSDAKGTSAYGDDLALEGGSAYFSNNAWRPKNHKRDSAIYVVPVDGSAPAEVVVKGAGFLTIDEGRMKYATGVDEWVIRDLASGETTPAPVSPRAKDPGFCGAEFSTSYETLCMGEPAENETVADAVLTIKSSGRTTTFDPFPSDSLNNATPHDVRAVGSWTGVTMTGDTGAKRQFLVDLESGAMKAFPEDTGFVAMDRDGTQALIVRTTDAKRWPAMIVTIPTKN